VNCYIRGERVIYTTLVGSLGEVNAKLSEPDDPEFESPLVIPLIRYDHLRLTISVFRGKTPPYNSKSLATFGVILCRYHLMSWREMHT